MYRINTSAEFAFDRISRAIDGFYLLGVESRPDDRNGRRHRISVKAIRKGVSIRSRRSFLTSVSGKATTPVDAVTRALKSPLPINDLPIKVATWTYKEPGSAKVRVLIAAEVERLSEQSLDYTAGMLLIDRNGRGLMPPTTLKKLTIKDGDPGTAVYTGMLSVDPGSYRLGLAMSDSEGRVGSVSRGITAWQMNGAELAMGDLMLGSVTGPDRSGLSARDRAGDRGRADGCVAGGVRWRAAGRWRRVDARDPRGRKQPRRWRPSRCTWPRGHRRRSSRRARSSAPRRCRRDGTWRAARCARAARRSDT